MRKLWLIGLIGMMILIILSSCAKREPAVKKKEIVFTIWGSVAEANQMKGWLEKFEKKFPNIKVKLIHPGGSYNEKVLAMCAAGTPPDVMMVGTAGFGIIYALAEKGLLMPLDNYIDEEYRKGIFKEAWKGVTWKGHIYALPREANAEILFYNKDLFDKEGIPYPDESWTWETLIEVAKKITKEENGRIIQYGLYSLPWFITAFAYGCKFFDEEGKFVFKGKEDTGAKKALELYLKAYKEGATPFPLAEETSFGGFWTSILSGRIGMWITGPWGCQELIKRGVKFRWDMALIPKGDRRVTPLTFVGYGITKKAKNKDACLKLIKFLTSPEIMQDFAYTGRAFPASILAFQQSYLKHPGYNQVVHKEIPFESLKYGEEFFRTPYLLEIKQVVKDVSDSVILGKLTIEEGLEEMKDRVIEILQGRKGE